MNTKIATGVLGEDIAVRFLKRKGYKILERNHRNKLGEIDIIAKDTGGTISFIEVKARYNLDFDHPQYAVTDFKKNQISKTALAYLKRNGLLENDARFDVVSILLADDKRPIKMELIKNAFELDGGYGY